MYECEGYHVDFKHEKIIHDGESKFDCPFCKLGLALVRFKKDLFNIDITSKELAFQFVQDEEVRGAHGH